jgi:hypothetical protein
MRLIAKTAVIAIALGLLATGFVVFMNWRIGIHLQEATVIPLWERVGYGIAMFLRHFWWMLAVPFIGFGFMVAFLTERK